jgi:flagellar protein FlaG
MNTVKIIQRADYREDYANSVQVRPSTWDFFLQFGRLEQKQSDEVELHMFQGVFLSPQQAKAVLNLLKTHMENYEKAFGEVQLQPLQPPGPVQ